MRPIRGGPWQFAGLLLLATGETVASPVGAFAKTVTMDMQSSSTIAAALSDLLPGELLLIRSGTYADAPDGTQTFPLNVPSDVSVTKYPGD